MPRPAESRNKKSHIALFVRHHNRFLIVTGALIVFTTFLVKEALGNNLGELVVSLHDAQNLFLMRQDHLQIEADLKDLHDANQDAELSTGKALEQNFPIYVKRMQRIERESRELKLAVDNLG